MYGLKVSIDIDVYIAIYFWGMVEDEGRGAITHLRTVHLATATPTGAERRRLSKQSSL